METTRREWLETRIAESEGPYTTHWAEDELAASPFSHHRNSARKTLRSIARDGALVPVEVEGRTAYVRPETERAAA